MNFIISSSIILFIDFTYVHLLLTRKRSIKHTLFILLINYLMALLADIPNYIFLKGTVYDKYGLYVIAFSFITYISLCYEENISRKIFTLYSTYLFSNVVLIICTQILTLFSFKNLNLYKFPFSLLTIFIQLTFIPIIYVYFRRPYKKMLKVLSNKVINIMSFYIVVTYLFVINYYEFSSVKPQSLYEVFNNLLFLIIIILSYIIVFIAIMYANRSMELEYKFKIIDAQTELQKQNYKTLNKSLENYYEFKHDIRHHLLAIKTMMDAENYRAASEYLNQFAENEISQSIGILCKNFTVDSILKYYISIAINANIDFKVNLNIPQDINIDNLDLSIVIGNCVENAIEACKNSIDDSKKYINVKAEMKGSQLIVKIKNSFNGQVIKENGDIKTSKKGKGHGIGLSNVKNIAEKYNGYFNVKYNDTEFEVHIVMNIKSNNL